MHSEWKPLHQYGQMLQWQGIRAKRQGQRQGNYDSCGSSPLERSAGDCKGLVCVFVCVKDGA